MSRMRRFSIPMVWPLIAGMLVISSLLTSCGDSLAEPQDASGSFVGRVPSTNLFVAVVTDGANVRAYLCDGAPDRQLTVSEWFRGTQSGRDLDITSLSGSARIVAQIGPAGATGRIEISGRPPVTFTAEPAQGSAGFYLFKTERAGEMHWAGWIVLPNGEQRGSMAQPSRTSLGIRLDVASGTAQLPGLGTVTPGPLTPSRVVAGFQGCYPCLQCC